MSNNVEVKLEDVAELCVEYWKLERLAWRMIEEVDPKKSNRFAGQVKFAARQLEVLCSRFDIKLVDFSGQEFKDGMPVPADNLSDFPETTSLIIEKPLEPAVIRNGKVIRSGRVLLAAIENKENG